MEIGFLSLKPYFTPNFMDSPPSSGMLPIKLNDLFHFAAHQDQIAWQPYKKGVDIFRLYGDGVTGPTAALVRYREHGEVPLHEHPGLRTHFDPVRFAAGRKRDIQRRNPGDQSARHTAQGPQ